MRKPAKPVEQWRPSGSGDSGLPTRRLVSQIKSQWLRGEPADAQAVLAQQSPRDRRILELLRQGFTHAETARQVGVNEKTIRRLIQKLDLGSAS